MLKILLKKQLMELFRNSFYNSRKKQSRSRRQTVTSLVLFGLLMAVVLGGAFTAAALGLHAGLVENGEPWLYFLIMGGMALLLGVFGSVFSTYTSLYRSGDNDLLLSMPIPAGTIVAARLIGTCFMCVLFTLPVFLPALLVNWLLSPVTLASLAGGVVMLAVLILLEMVLVCLLGWVVAVVSRRVKNKSLTTTVVSLLGIGAYYFLYAKAQSYIRNMAQHAAEYGERIRSASEVLYSFGSIGTGEGSSMALWTAGAAVLFLGVWRLLAKSFLPLATAPATGKKAVYREKAVRQTSVERALLRKELCRFSSSAAYMLNCGLGMLFLPAAGILLLLKGQGLLAAVSEALGGGCVPVLVCAVVCLLVSTCDMAAPSVSLEGKNLWLLQMLPVSPRQVLGAKLKMHVYLTGIPALICALCCAFSLGAASVEAVLLVPVVLIYVLFSASLNLYLGLKMPVLTWTNEVVPIKQSGAVAIALFGGWGIALVLGGAWFLLGHVLGGAGYLLLCAALLLLGYRLLRRWIMTKGAEILGDL